MVRNHNWVIISLNELANMKSGEAITSARIFTMGKYPCYGANGFRGYTNSFTHEGNYALIGRQGALSGNMTFVSGKFYASEHAIAVTPKRNYDIKYLYYLLDYMNLNQYIESTAQPGLSVKKILRLEVLTTIDLVEQSVISRVLSDIDSLIVTLEKLIIKKKNIKQGVIHELLTGKKRLSGFDKNWKSVNLSKTSQIKARIGWQGLTTSEYLEDGFSYLVTGTDFEDGRINWRTCHFVTKNRFDQDPYIQLKNGDVLITKDGTIGKVAIVEGLHMPATLNSGVFVVRPLSDDYTNEFLYYILMSNVFKKFVKELMAGSTITHLYQKDLIKFNFYVPPTKKEQDAITNIIRDMDEDIHIAERKLQKYKRIKTGMMQKLLTGEIRLV